MKLVSLVVPAVLAIAACGGKTKAPVGPPSSGDVVLAITDLKFYAGDKAGMHLYPDGRLSVLHSENGVESWQDVGVVKADGTITANAGGESMRVGADGSFVAADGKVEKDVKLDGDTLLIDNKRVTIDASGNFLVDGKQGDKPLRVEGASDAKAQRTALVIAALMFGGSSGAPSKAEATTPAKE